MKPYIFISYSHSPEDREAVNDFVKRLEKAGIEYFLDEKNIRYGENIPNAVQLALEKATHVVAFLSPGSEVSQWVFFEIGIAYSNHKTIVLRLLHSKMKIPSFIVNAKYMTGIEDEIAFIEQIKPSEERPDELEIYLTKNVNFNDYQFETSEKWGLEYYCIYQEFDGEETMYIFWNKDKKRLHKNHLSYSGVRWYGKEKLNKNDKMKVCEILNIPITLAG